MTSQIQHIMSILTKHLVQIWCKFLILNLFIDIWTIFRMRKKTQSLYSYLLRAQMDQLCWWNWRAMRTRTKKTNCSRVLRWDHESLFILWLFAAWQKVLFRHAEKKTTNSLKFNCQKIVNMYVCVGWSLGNSILF